MAGEFCILFRDGGWVNTESRVVELIPGAIGIQQVNDLGGEAGKIILVLVGYIAIGIKQFLPGGFTEHGVLPHTIEEEGFGYGDAIEPMSHHPPGRNRPFYR